MEERKLDHFFVEVDFLSKQVGHKVFRALFFPGYFLDLREPRKAVFSG